MVAQKGKDLLLKIDDGGSFVTVAGLRSKRIAFNSETVDITDADSAGRWRELLAGSGVQRAAISGSGIFKDAAVGRNDPASDSSPARSPTGSSPCRVSARSRGRSRSPRSNIPAATTAR